MDELKDAEMKDDAEDVGRFVVDSMGKKWDENIHMNELVNDEKEIIKMLETEIVRLEKEAERAATEDYKKLVGKKLHDAQLKLKNSLLRMSLEQDKMMDTESGNTGDQGHIIDLTEAEDKNGYIHQNVGIEDEPMSTTDHPGEKGSNKTKGNKNLVYDGRRGIETFKWGDESDDDTVTLQNQSTSNLETTWQVVKNKKQSKNGDASETANTSTIGNPYNKKQQKTTSANILQENKKGNSSKSSLASFLEITKGKMRSKNEHSIRVTISFTPNTSGNGEYLRVARELLTFGREIDNDILLLPWVDSQELGPISIEDLANPKNLIDSIKKYFDKPPYANWQPGAPMYGIGVQFSTNFGKHEFMTRWNLKKQEHKQNHRAAHAIAMAPMQNSHSSFIIGIAVGSTEKQDYDLLIERLASAAGIEGIDVSFQNINQAGVTQEFWKLANEKALTVNLDKYSRGYLREKYRWAPNALAIFVPKREMVAAARKVMLQKFGKAKDGKDPIWPDGSSMRFLPIKGANIKNEKTKDIVRKRMAYHIWLKVNEVTIETNMVNINQSIDAFNGATFAEIVLASTNEENQRVFAHFTRAWSRDPSKGRWGISVRGHLQDDAFKVINNLKDDLYDKYGQEIELFFNDTHSNTSWKDAVTKSQAQEDEDEWFDDDDDIEDMVKKGFVDSTFLRFFKSQKDIEEDKQSTASWGTGNTTYTEIVTTQETIGTVNSSITQDTALATDEETDRKRSIVRVRLLLKGINEEEIEDILSNKPPYELAFSGINLPSWDPDKEVFMLLAIYHQYKPTNQTIN